MSFGTRSTRDPARAKQTKLPQESHSYAVLVLAQRQRRVACETSSVSQGTWESSTGTSGREWEDGLENDEPTRLVVPKSYGAKRWMTHGTSYRAFFTGWGRSDLPSRRKPILRIDCFLASELASRMRHRSYHLESPFLSY